MEAHQVQAAAAVPTTVPPLTVTAPPTTHARCCPTCGRSVSDPPILPMVPLTATASDLTNQVRSIAQVTKAVAGGDLTKRIEVEASGEIFELKETVNGMTESLRVFADEVTRVIREVGTEGRLGGQARVTNVGGMWKDLTDNVNVMANNVRFVLLLMIFFGRLNSIYFFFLNYYFRLSVDVTSANHRCGYCMFIYIQ